MICKT